MFQFRRIFSHECRPEKTAGDFYLFIYLFFKSSSFSIALDFLVASLTNPLFTWSLTLVVAPYSFFNNGFNDTPWDIHMRWTLYPTPRDIRSAATRLTLYTLMLFRISCMDTVLKCMIGNGMNRTERSLYRIMGNSGQQKVHRVRKIFQMKLLQGCIVCKHLTQTWLNAFQPPYYCFSRQYSLTLTHPWTSTGMYWPT